MAWSMQSNTKTYGKKSNLQSTKGYIAPITDKENVENNENPFLNTDKKRLLDQELSTKRSKPEIIDFLHQEIEQLLELLKNPAIIRSNDVTLNLLTESTSTQQKFYDYLSQFENISSWGSTNSISLSKSKVEKIKTELTSRLISMIPDFASSSSISSSTSSSTSSSSSFTSSASSSLSTSLSSSLSLRNNLSLTVSIPQDESYNWKKYRDTKSIDDESGDSTPVSSLPSSLSSPHSPTAGLGFFPSPTSSTPTSISPNSSSFSTQPKQSNKNENENNVKSRKQKGRNKIVNRLPEHEGNDTLPQPQPQPQRLHFIPSSRQNRSGSGSSVDSIVDSTIEEPNRFLSEYPKKLEVSDSGDSPSRCSSTTSSSHRSELSPQPTISPLTILTQVLQDQKLDEVFQFSSNSSSQPPSFLKKSPNLFLQNPNTCTNSTSSLTDLTSSPFPFLPSSGKLIVQMPSPLSNNHTLLTPHVKNVNLNQNSPFTAINSPTQSSSRLMFSDSVTDTPRNRSRTRSMLTEIHETENENENSNDGNESDQSEVKVPNTSFINNYNYINNNSSSSNNNSNEELGLNNNLLTKKGTRKGRPKKNKQTNSEVGAELKKEPEKSMKSNFPNNKKTKGKTNEQLPSQYSPLISDPLPNVNIPPQFMIVSPVAKKEEMTSLLQSQFHSPIEKTKITISTKFSSFQTIPPHSNDQPKTPPSDPSPLSPLDINPLQSPSQINFKSGNKYRDSSEGGQYSNEVMQAIRGELDNQPNNYNNNDQNNQNFNGDVTRLPIQFSSPSSSNQGIAERPPTSGLFPETPIFPRPILNLQTPAPKAPPKRNELRRTQTMPNPQPPTLLTSNQKEDYPLSQNDAQKFSTPQKKENTLFYGTVRHFDFGISLPTDSSTLQFLEQKLEIHKTKKKISPESPSFSIQTRPHSSSVDSLTSPHLQWFNGGGGGGGGGVDGEEVCRGGCGGGFQIPLHIYSIYESNLPLFKNPSTSCKSPRVVCCDGYCERNGCSRDDGASPSLTKSRTTDEFEERKIRDRRAHSDFTPSKAPLHFENNVVHSYMFSSARFPQGSTSLLGGDFRGTGVKVSSSSSSSSSSSTSSSSCISPSLDPLLPPVRKHPKVTTQQTEKRIKSSASKNRRMSMGFKKMNPHSPSFPLHIEKSFQMGEFDEREGGDKPLPSLPEFLNNPNYENEIEIENDFENNNENNTSFHSNHSGSNSYHHHLEHHHTNSVNGDDSILSCPSPYHDLSPCVRNKYKKAKMKQRAKRRNKHGPLSSSNSSQSSEEEENENEIMEEEGENEIKRNQIRSILNQSDSSIEENFPIHSQWKNQVDSSSSSSFPFNPSSSDDPQEEYHIGECGEGKFTEEENIDNFNSNCHSFLLSQPNPSPIQRINHQSLATSMFDNTDQFNCEIIQNKYQDLQPYLLNVLNFKSTIFAGTYQHFFYDDGFPLIQPPIAQYEPHVNGLTIRRTIDEFETDESYPDTSTNNHTTVEIKIYVPKFQSCIRERLGENWHWTRVNPSGYLIYNGLITPGSIETCYYLTKHPIEYLSSYDSSPLMEGDELADNKADLSIISLVSSIHSPNLSKSVCDDPNGEEVDDDHEDMIDDESQLNRMSNLSFEDNPIETSSSSTFLPNSRQIPFQCSPHSHPHSTPLKTSFSSCFLNIPMSPSKPQDTMALFPKGSHHEEKTQEKAVNNSSVWNNSSIVMWFLEFLLTNSSHQFLSHSTSSTANSQRKNKKTTKQQLDRELEEIHIQRVNYRLVSKSWAMAYYRFEARHLSQFTSSASLMNKVQRNRFNSHYQWGCFLSEGACKMVYSVLNPSLIRSETQNPTTTTSLGSGSLFEAISVMDINDLKERDMTCALTQEIEISIVCSTLNSLKICPNLLQIYSLFQTDYPAPKSLWNSNYDSIPEFIKNSLKINLFSNFSTSLSSAQEQPRTIPMTATKGDGKFQFIRMELCKGGDLEDFVRQAPSGDGLLHLEILRIMMFQMCFSLYTCRDQLSLRHFDIKLLNFFLASPTSLLEPSERLKYESYFFQQEQSTNQTSSNHPPQLHSTSIFASSSPPIKNSSALIIPSTPIVSGFLSSTSSSFSSSTSSTTTPSEFNFKTNCDPSKRKKFPSRTCLNFNNCSFLPSSSSCPSLSGLVSNFDSFPPFPSAPFYNLNSTPQSTSALQPFTSSSTNFFSSSSSLYPSSSAFLSQSSSSALSTPVLPLIDMIVSIGPLVYHLPLSLENFHLVKLADFGTSAMGTGALGDPITIQQFTTLENTPPEFLLTGSDARQSFSNDTFPLGLSFLHLFIGKEPYEVLLKDVKCPHFLAKKWYESWSTEEKCSPFFVIQEVVTSLDENSLQNEEEIMQTDKGISKNKNKNNNKSSPAFPGMVLYHTLYRYFVLFGDTLYSSSSSSSTTTTTSSSSSTPHSFVDCPYSSSPIWRIAIETLFPTSPDSSGVKNYKSKSKKTNDKEAKEKKECQNAFQADRFLWSLHNGTHELMKNARGRMSEFYPKTLDLMSKMVHFYPSRRPSLFDLLTSPIFSPLLKIPYPTVSYQNPSVIEVPFTHYATQTIESLNRL